MNKMLSPDICVIGAGSAGLTVAAAASQLGALTVLVEKGLMGGDCLNYGCVPSKSLLAAGRAAVQAHNGIGGIHSWRPDVDFAGVHDYVQNVIAAIAPQDSVERFEGLGVRVLREPARFTSRTEIAAGEQRIAARRFVIATGSAPLIPAVAGLERVPYFTNETIFDNRSLPRHLIVIGGGSVGMEIGQAYAHLGAKVTIIEMERILGRDDPEVARVVADRLRRDGVTLLERTRVTGVDGEAGRITVEAECEGGTPHLEGSHLLVAAGRLPNIDGLELATAGIAHSARRIEVDPRLRTSNRKVYAIGDVVGRYPFTHVANHHAMVVVRNALFRQPTKVNDKAVPWVTYTDPELAHVGLTEEAARARYGGIRILRWPFADVDRAVTEERTDGFIKVVTTGRGQILGASIAGCHAGELVLPWVMAIEHDIKILAMAKLIAPYPTYSEISKRVAGSYFTPLLFSERARKLVRFLSRFG